MSSIFGYLGKENNIAASESFIASLKKWNHYYGTDSDFTAEEGYGFGSYVDHFSDRFEAGKPVIRRGNRIYVTDALIYNRDELTEILSVDPDTRMSDEDLMIDLIEKSGSGAVVKVNGDFAGACYDTDTGVLKLYRDHTGVRQLYYYYDGKNFAFSTDMRSLGAIPDADLTLDEEELWKWLAAYNSLSLDKTVFKNIRCVKPGHVLTVDLRNGGISEERYWKPGTKKIRLENDEAYIKEMRRLVEDSIRRRAEAFSGRIGAELSGGLDSSVIDIILARQGKNPKCVSWSMVPKDWPLVPGDERLIIRDICERESLEFEYPDRSERNLYLPENAVPPIVGRVSQLGDVAEYMKRNGCMCVFSGNGGDEGVSHRCNVSELRHYGEYRQYFREIWAESKRNPIRFVKGLYSSGKRYRKYQKPARMADPSKVFNKEYLEKMKNIKGERNLFAIDTVAAFEYGGIRPRPENASFEAAPYGVRYVFPYQDHRVFDYAVSIPRYLYKKNGKNRWIYRQAFDDLMPESLREVNYKDNPSIREKSPKPAITRNEIKERILTELDREMWSGYLDFEALEALNVPEISEIRGDPERHGRGRAFIAAVNLFWIQNFIGKCGDDVCGQDI